MSRAAIGDATSFVSWGTSAADVGPQYEEFCVDPGCTEGRRSFDYLQRNVGYAADQMEKVEQGEMDWEDVDSHVFRRVESLSESFDDSLGDLDADETAQITDAEMKRLEQQRERLDQHLEGAMERTLADTELDQRYDPEDFSDPTHNRIHHEVDTVTDDAGSRIENLQNALDSTKNILRKEGVAAANTAGGPDADSGAADALDGSESDSGSASRDGEGVFDGLGTDAEANAYSFADVDARLTGSECTDCGDHTVTTREYGQGIGSWVSGSLGVSTTLGTSYSPDLSDWKNPGVISVEGPSLSVGKSAEKSTYCTNPLCEEGLTDLSKFHNEIEQFTTDLDEVAAGERNWGDLDPDDARRISAVADGYRDSVTRIDDRLEEQNFNVTETLRRFDHKMSDLDEALGDAIQETATGALSEEEVESIKRGDAQLDGLDDRIGLTDRARNAAAEETGRNVGIVGAIQNTNDAVRSVETARTDVLEGKSTGQSEPEPVAPEGEGRRETSSEGELSADGRANSDSHRDQDSISRDVDRDERQRPNAGSSEEGDTDAPDAPPTEGTDRPGVKPAADTRGSTADSGEFHTSDAEESDALDRHKRSAEHDTEDRELEPEGGTEEPNAGPDSDALAPGGSTPGSRAPSNGSEAEGEPETDALAPSDVTVEADASADSHERDGEADTDALEPNGGGDGVSDDAAAESTPGSDDLDTDSDAIGPDGGGNETPDESAASDESDAIAPETDPEEATPSDPGETDGEDESEGSSIW